LSFTNLIFGRPIPTSEERAEQIGVAAGIPIFGLDALSSAGYGPEAALTLLIPLGYAGIVYIIPISTAIILLLTIVFFSYRQTIAAYPGGAGSYTVASENLGRFPGLLAATALMIDYILTVAVGISAGIGALVSAAPALLPHTLALCLGALVLITIINLRGVRETGTFFMIPTYAFVGTLVITILWGLTKVVFASGHPVPVEVPPPPAAAGGAVVSLWLLMQAFAGGCTAMTGVEAVSNGAKAFREPTVRNAQRTLTIIIGILIFLLGGIAYLARAYGITATDPGLPGYQSVLSILVAAVAGRGVFYYITSASVLLVLSLSANTAFADFPRLCRAISENSFLPHSMGYRGRRLVYTEGICVLAVISGLLLIFFDGVTNRLIPLYAVGAFLAFTMSQAGMVVHWWKKGGPGSRHSMVVNAVGAVATGITLLVVAVAKFVSGAWVTVLLVPTIIALMYLVRGHYDRVSDETSCSVPLELDHVGKPVVVVPVKSWSRLAEKALLFALTISSDIHAVHVKLEADDNDLEEHWEELAAAPAKRAGLAPPQLTVLQSPYRYILLPILTFVGELEAASPDSRILIIVPEIVERRWYEHLLYNARTEILRGLLLLRGSRRTVLVTIPWYLSDREGKKNSSQNG
jgi:amino acid transporter